jgi:hypothetical protein
MRGPAIMTGPLQGENMRKSEKTGKIRTAEREILKGACELHEMAVVAVELDAWRMAFPGIDEDEPWMGTIMDELMGVLVQECPEDVYIPGIETLKWAALGNN